MRKLLLSMALAWLGMNGNRAGAEPVLEKTDLFRGGEGGFELYRIPGIVVTRKGSVLAYCEARSDARSDWGEIQVQMRRSTDGGRSWEAARQIGHFGARIEGNPTKATGGDKEQTVNNPVAIVDWQSGAIHFLYCVNYARCFYIRSDDDGVTFSVPVEITGAFEGFRAACDWKVIATGPGHGIQIRSGRLVVPVWLAYGKMGAHSPSVAGVIFSDDHGNNWQAGQIAFPNIGNWKNPNETAVVELGDGSVMLNARNQSNENRRLVSVSRNGACDWTPPSFDPSLWEPICMGSLARHPISGEILFSNPRNLKRREDGSEVPGEGGERKNLSIQISDDEAKSWKLSQVLEAGRSGYSDLSVLPNGDVLCFYERSKLLTVARFNRAWLSQGAAQP